MAPSPSASRTTAGSDAVRRAQRRRVSVGAGAEDHRRKAEDAGPRRTGHADLGRCVPAFRDRARRLAGRAHLRARPVSRDHPAARRKLRVSSGSAEDRAKTERHDERERRRHHADCDRAPGALIVERMPQPTIMAPIIQSQAPTNTGTAMPGRMPKTCSSPGAAAKPVVRSSSPSVALVCGSASRRVPIWNISMPRQAR